MLGYGVRFSFVTAIVLLLWYFITNICISRSFILILQCITFAYIFCWSRTVTKTTFRCLSKFCPYFLAFRTKTISGLRSVVWRVRPLATSTTPPLHVTCTVHAVQAPRHAFNIVRLLLKRNFFLFMPSPPFFRHKSREYSVILLFTCVGRLSVMNLIHHRYRKTRPSRVVIPTLSCPNSNDRRLNRPKSCDEHVRNKVRCKNYNRPRRIVRFVNKPTTAADCI